MLLQEIKIKKEDIRREHTYKVLKEGEMVEETGSERLQKEKEIIALVLPRPAPFT